MARQIYPLDLKIHGMGGATMVEPRPRDQDERAEPAEFFAVVFFPKFEGIGGAYTHNSRDTLAQTKDAAIARFLDNMRAGEVWETYHNAGWRVRKVQIVDMGDA